MYAMYLKVFASVTYDWSGMWPLWIAIGIILFILIIYFASKVYIAYRTEKEREEYRNNIVKNNIPMTPEEFYEKARLVDFEGVYVIHNLSKDMYYVGQSICVADRVKSHLSGRGNGDVYADYKHNDRFEIILIALEDSNCKSLNELERKTIDAYHAYDRGYNKTRGNFVEYEEELDDE